MKIGIKWGIFTSLAFIVIILALFMAKVNLRSDFMQIMVGAGTLCLFIGVALSILINYNKNRHGGLSMLVDIKTGIASSAVFAVIISIFLVLYFSTIDSEFAERRKQDLIERMQDPEAVAELQEQMDANPDTYKGKSLDDMIERNIDNVEHMLSPGTVFPIALFSLLLLGMVYSFLITAFNRLILAKLR
jgi:ABC-type proline/glycine betaine transport system permease subunit